MRLTGTRSTSRRSDAGSRSYAMPPRSASQARTVTSRSKMHGVIRDAADTDVDRLVALERACGVTERSAEAYRNELSLVWSRVLVLELPNDGVVASLVYWTV